MNIACQQGYYKRVWDFYHMRRLVPIWQNLIYLILHIKSKIQQELTLTKMIVSEDFHQVFQYEIRMFKS